MATQESWGGAPDHEITRSLRSWAAGDDGAFDRLVPVVYAELKRLARWQLAGNRAAEGLETTGLVHEAYLKLVQHGDATVRDRQHFFRLAAQVMRQVVVDQARSRARLKRGGGQPALPGEDLAIGVEDHAELVLAVHQVLDRLESRDERLARVVECRFFSGLTVDETAEALGVATTTVERDWVRARAWLKTALSAERSR